MWPKPKTLKGVLPSYHMKPMHTLNTGPSGSRRNNREDRAHESSRFSPDLPAASNESLEAPVPVDVPAKMLYDGIAGSSACALRRAEEPEHVAVLQAAQSEPVAPPRRRCSDV